MTAIPIDSRGVVPHHPVRLAYETDLGAMFHGKVEDFLDACGRSYRGRIQLIYFSPPFPLTR